ncbi:hypothetical protein LUZ60_008569 [Juncus effusus]|nr:hypothetical protein LUZ60_008569 [Juncus effusus]
MRIEEMEPLITVGAAFALSVAGYFMSNRQPKPTNSIRATRSESDLSRMADPSTSSSSVGPSRCPVTGSNPATTPGICPRGFKRGLRIIENDDAHVNVIQRATVAPPILLSPLLEEPEEETEITISNESINPSQKETDQEPKTELETKSETEQQNIGLSEKEEEIERLRNLAQSLLDKERNLEMQMLEYYGLKEQEEAMREMVKELTVNSMETKYLTSKVESLEEENERLKRQILEMEKMREKLDSNKGKISTLKKRLRLEDENVQEKIVLLRQRIEVLSEKNNKSSADYEEIESKLARIKELEEEVNQLRKINSKLEEENCGLTQRLENAQLAASRREPEEQVLEEASQLRETNENLAKQIDQLLDDHSSSVVEIVYLKWVNACLRYELRNFNDHSKNESMARDLNKSPSHNSMEMVKQLIIEYSNKGIDIRDPNFDFDFSSSPLSRHSSSSTPAQKSEKTTPKGKNKKPNNFLNSIKKIMTGNKHSNSSTNKGKSPLLSPDSVSYCSNNSSPLSGITTIEPASNFPRSANHPRASLNIPTSRKMESENSRSLSDLGSRFIRPRYQSLHLDHPSMDFEDPKKKEINRLAHALRSSSASPAH